MLFAGLGVTRQKDQDVVPPDLSFLLGENTPMRTNFAALTDEQYTVWSRQFWREARNKTFLNVFAGSSANRTRTTMFQQAGKPAKELSRVFMRVSEKYRIEP